MPRRYHLYVDDSGSRHPDREPVARADGMDHFALGGFLIAEDDIPLLLRAYDRLISKWELRGPLHSTRIRGKRGAFSWMANNPERADMFMSDLEGFLVALPLIGTACVIDRVGYNTRYNARYGGKPWLMCKTAYAILIDRAVKYAKRSNGTVKVFVESSGKKEDGDIRLYHREIKLVGMPFDSVTSANYKGLTRDDFLETLLGEPHFVKKDTPMIQIADLYLFAMAKGGYDPDYPPYRALSSAHRIIDCLLPPGDIPFLGIKYSCFENKK